MTNKLLVWNVFGLIMLRSSLQAVIGATASDLTKGDPLFKKYFHLEWIGGITDFCLCTGLVFPARGLLSWLLSQRLGWTQESDTSSTLRFFSHHCLWTHLQQMYTCHCTWVQSDHADISDLSRSIGNKTYYGEVTGKEKKNSSDDKERHKKPPSPTEGRWVLCIWLCSGKGCTFLPPLSWLPWHAHPWIYRQEQLNWMLSALSGVIPIPQAM